MLCVPNKQNTKMGKEKEQNRRDFITKSTLLASGISLGINTLSSAEVGRTIGANDKIRMGFIGIGNRGSQLLELFMQNKDVEVAALCDIYEPYLLRDRSKVDPRYLADRAGQVPKMGENFPASVARYTDYRKLLEDKTIDAITIATPNHWHALATIWACQAGKDVYVEKPGTHNIYEGKKVIEAAYKYNRIVQHGVQLRSSVELDQLFGRTMRTAGASGAGTRSRGACWSRARRKTRPSTIFRSPWIFATLTWTRRGGR
jgi:hypothetical protein